MAVAALLVLIIVLLPLGVLSVLSDVVHSTPATYRLDTTPATDAVRGNLHLQVVGLNEWEGTVSVRVSASQTCGRTCAWGDRYVFVAAWSSASGGAGETRTESEDINLPADARDVVKVIRLPVTGDPIRYPFDSYRLAFGIEVERVAANGSVRILSPHEAERYTDITLQGRVPRGTMGAPRSVTTHLLPLKGDDHLVVSAQLHLARPLYLQVLTLLLVLLVAAAGAFAVLMRPLDQLVINSGALLLGVWGVRAILLGPSVPGLTLVDIALVIVIMFLLVAITVRTLWLLEESSSRRLLRRRQTPPS
jgi:hypothetical protein